MTENIRRSLDIFRSTEGTSGLRVRSGLRAGVDSKLDDGSGQTPQDGSHPVVSGFANASEQALKTPAYFNKRMHR